MIHKARVLTTKEVMERRSNAYDFIDIELPKCRCDKYLASKGFHNNGCKYAIQYNKIFKIND